MAGEGVTVTRGGRPAFVIRARDVLRVEQWRTSPPTCTRGVFLSRGFSRLFLSARAPRARRIPAPSSAPTERRRADRLRFVLEDPERGSRGARRAARSAGARPRPHLLPRSRFSRRARVISTPRVSPAPPRSPATRFPRPRDRSEAAALAAPARLAVGRGALPLASAFAPRRPGRPRARDDDGPRSPTTRPRASNDGRSPRSIARDLTCLPPSSPPSSLQAIVQRTRAVLERPPARPDPRRSDTRGR
jgi:hypothetical protein